MLHDDEASGGDGIGHRLGIAAPQAVHLRRVVTRGGKRLGIRAVRRLFRANHVPKVSARVPLKRRAVDVPARIRRHRDGVVKNRNLVHACRISRRNGIRECSILHVPDLRNSGRYAVCDRRATIVRRHEHIVCGSDDCTVCRRTADGRRRDGRCVVDDDVISVLKLDIPVGVASDERQHGAIRHNRVAEARDESSACARLCAADRDG